MSCDLIGGYRPPEVGASCASCALGATGVVETSLDNCQGLFGEEVKVVRTRVGRAYGAATAKRLIGVLVLVALLPVSVVVGAPANADNSADFLTMVSKTGINVGDSPADIAITLSKGLLACRLLYFGYPTEVAIREVHYAFPDATRAQLVSFVDAAKAKLCEANFGQLNPAN